MDHSRYRRLDAERIVATIASLRDRIRKHFPRANLADVAEELHSVATGAVGRSREIRQPNPWLRATSVTLLVVGTVTLGAAVASVHPQVDDGWRLTDVVQTFESFLGGLFFLSAGVASVVTIEARSKRRRCLDALHEMRAMAHIVDMHQLAKSLDHPEPSWHDGTGEARRALICYLDYCSEMLALMGKVAALYVQDFPDAQAVTAVDEVEDLTTGLSRKIWQKIMILSDEHGDVERSSPAAS